MPLPSSSPFTPTLLPTTPTLNQRTYPVLDNSTSADIKRAIKQAFDYIFQLQSEITSTSVLQDKSTNLNLYSPAKYALGTFFIATDTFALYSVMTIGGAKAWRQIGGSGGGGIGTSYVGVCSSPLTLTTVYQDIPGCTVTLAAAGTYLIMGVADFIWGSPDGELGVQCVVNGSFLVPALIYGVTTTELVLSRSWIAATTGPSQIAKLQGRKVSGTGSSSIFSTTTEIDAIRIA